MNEVAKEGQVHTTKLCKKSERKRNLQRVESNIESAIIL